jgi:signal transduction histidine kinase
MFKGIFNRLYRINIGTRTAFSFLAVVIVSLFFSVAALLLLEYSKKIDTKISDKYRPVISALKDYQSQIETTILLSSDISSQYNEKKRRVLTKQLDRTYNEKKLTVIGMSQEASMEGIRLNVIEIDGKFQKIMEKERAILALMKGPEDYNDKEKLRVSRLINDEIEILNNPLSAKLEETSMEAIYIFRKLEAQKYASYRTLSYLLVVMIVIIIVVSIFSIYITQETIIKPIKEISGILDELSEGKVLSFQSEVYRNDEIGTMIESAKKVAAGFKTKTEVANAIGKGNYLINVPLLSKSDKLGKALVEMRNNLQKAKETEEKSRLELQEYTAILEKKNQELDQFAYVASHDLKSPLRGIHNLTDWIQEELGDNLQGVSLGYFNMLKGRVQRMESLINALLKYARSGKTLTEQRILPSKDSIIHVLKRINPPNNIAIYFEETLPTVFGNKKDFETVLYAFITNAIKHNEKANRIVNITFKEQGSEVAFCITDNGPGIEQEYHQKIFGIFQTLNRKDEVENLGAGLAIARKIIVEYGGSIWLESELGKGASFYFTWPKDNVTKLV